MSRRAAAAAAAAVVVHCPGTQISSAYLRSAVCPAPRALSAPPTTDRAPSPSPA